jgi:hypothetical protein
MNVPRLFGFTLLAMMAVLSVYTAVNSPHGASDKRKRPVYLGVEPTITATRSVVKGKRQNYTFPPSLQGDTIVHEFVIVNPGKTAYKVVGVEACDGVNVMSYPLNIPASGNGTLSVNISTDLYGGKIIEGPVTLLLAEGSVPSEIQVDIRLEVKRFASVSSYRLELSGPAGDGRVATAFIVPDPSCPFHVLGVKAKNGLYIEYGFQPKVENGVSGYEVYAKNISKKKGLYRDILFVKTDHPQRAELKIRVEGRITE